MKPLSSYMEEKGGYQVMNKTKTHQIFKGFASKILTHQHGNENKYLSSLL
jgi:hypothetical protein